VDDRMLCPKCGARMNQRALTDANGTPLGYAGGGESGALISMVCPECGYAELKAVELSDEGRNPTLDAEPVAHSVSHGGIGGSHAYSDAGRPGPSSGSQEVWERIHDFQEEYGSAGATPRLPQAEPGALALALGFGTAAVMIAGLVWLFMTATPVLRAGGFVASGGPYVIAHQAEDWVWLPSIATPLMVFALLGNLFLASRLNRPSLILVFWTALFGSLSIPFFTNGFHAPGGGVSVTGILLGVMFALMALPTALLLLRKDAWRGFAGAWGVANGLGLVVGFAGALWVWGLVT
jgi:hypothetical protein